MYADSTSALRCYVKPKPWIQNLCSPFCERLCFIWCPVHYCQHIWKVLSLETSPILFQAGLNISRQEAENETFPQETACSAFYLVQQSEGLILCKTHLNKQLYIYPPHLWDFSLFFSPSCVLLCRKMKNCKNMEVPLVLCSRLVSTLTSGTRSIQRPITRGVLSPPQEQKTDSGGKWSSLLSYTPSTTRNGKLTTVILESPVPSWYKTRSCEISLVHDFINV